MKLLTIDEAIRPLATKVPSCADDLLDLRLAALQRQEPGQCVACFFKILGFANLKKLDDCVDPLKNWIEQNLEIVATDHSSQELERLSVNLNGDSLEDYCYSVMEHIHFDRSYRTKQISLSFQFRATQAA